MSEREVTRDEFWAEIFPQDVHPRICGSYPYTSVFMSRSGIEKGRIVEFYPRVDGEPQKQYLLPK
jgi:hypothetical protein